MTVTKGIRLLSPAQGVKVIFRQRKAVWQGRDNSIAASSTIPTRTFTCIFRTRRACGYCGWNSSGTRVYHQEERGPGQILRRRFPGILSEITVKSANLPSAVNPFTIDLTPSPKNNAETSKPAVVITSAFTKRTLSMPLGASNTKQIAHRSLAGQMPREYCNTC